ncbi:MAG: hypothetical protein H7A46_04540 [Verrucomicrobiales bacterium]|nr:hypothetical protein [Verrucomicrobiales bacterium]
MIRHDYLLAWIRRYIQWIAEIAGLIKREDWEAALARADVALRGLLDLSPDNIHSLNEGEILARLTVGEPLPRVQEKSLLLATLLHQLGKIAAGQGRDEQARDAHLKSLHVMLGLQMHPEAADWPEFAPRLADLEEALRGYEIPARTHAALMIHHEQQRQFGKAEDALFEMLRVADHDPESIEIALGFYERLEVLSDEVLTLGRLPRAELEEGHRDLLHRIAARSGGQPPGSGTL